MNQDKENPQEQDNDSIISRYEEMRKTKSNVFFDVHEFEEIIDYYISRQKNQKALEVIRLANSQHPDSSTLRIKHAQVLINNDQPEDSLRVLARIEKIEKYNSDFYLIKGSAFIALDNFDAAKSNFDTAINLNTENSIEILEEVTNILLSNGIYELAEFYLEKLNILEPNNIQILFDLATCYNNLGKTKETISLYQNYLEQDPFSDSAWFNLGIIQIQEELYKEAIESFDFSLALVDEFASTYYYKAIAHMNMEDYDAAIKVYRDFMEMDEESEEIYCYIGECYERQNDYDNAKKYYIKSLELNSKFADSWYGLGLVNKSQNNLKDALDNILTAVKLNDASHEYWFGLGELYSVMGNTLEALRAYRNAFERNQQDLDAWLSYANTLHLQDNTKDAIQILKEAFTLNIDAAVLYYRIAAYYYLLGDVDNLVKYFERGLVLVYDDHTETFEFAPESKNLPKIQELLTKYNTLKK